MPESPGGQPEAGAQLEAAARAQARAQDAAVRSRDGLFLCLMGGYFGVLTLAIGLTEHTTRVGLMVTIIGGSVLVIPLAMWRERVKRATAAGWSRRTAWSGAATVALYAAGVLLAAFNAGGLWPWFWPPYAVLAAAPAVVAGLREARSR